MYNRSVRQGDTSQPGFLKVEVLPIEHSLALSFVRQTLHSLVAEPKLWVFLKAYFADATGKMSQVKDYCMSIFLIKIDDLFQEFGPEFGHVSEQ